MRIRLVAFAASAAVGLGAASLSGGCLQELLPFDAGPSLVSFGPDGTFAAVGVTGATWPDKLTVQLAEPDMVRPRAVRIVSSSPALEVADGGLLWFPAGSTELQVPLTGRQQAGSVQLTAVREGVELQSSVRVLGASELPHLAWVSPDAGTLRPGAKMDIAFGFDAPSQYPASVEVAISPATLGTAPSTVDVAANEMQGVVSITAGSPGRGKVTLSVASSSLDVGVVVSDAGTALTGVVISELATTGTVSNDEFVELYNRGATAVSLTGYALEYRAAGTTNLFRAWHSFTGAPSIPAHGYYLVGGGGYVGAPDVSASMGGFLQMAATDGSMRLVDQTAVLDMVGWGNPQSASAWEGLPAPSPDATATQSLERKAYASSTAASMKDGGADAARGNSYDSDSNFSDFVLREVRDPQNSASAPEVP